MRKPDTSVVRFGKFPGEVLPDGWIPVVPDLAAEVISPNDLAYEVDEKVEEWLAAGTLLVWVINPETRKVRVHPANGPEVILKPDDELTGGEVLPSFRCKVADLFQVPTPSGMTASAS